MQLPTKTLLALLPYFLQVNSQAASGTGTTTRYWDCCKPSCAWSGKASLLAGSSSVTTCDINNNPLTDANAVNGCDGGTAYQCSNESPWAVTDDLAYGYAAVNIAGGSELSWCCACYELTFTSGAVAGKKMIVQATNTGGDLGSNQFDISIPGGGVGIFNGCTAEWGAPSSGWGAQYGGISARSDCDSFPDALKDGCYWRFDWFGGSDNPTVSFQQVSCPAALTANTGCVRADDSAAAAASTPTGSVVASPSTVAAVVVSSSQADTSSTTEAPATSVESTSTPAAVVATTEAASSVEPTSTEVAVQSPTTQVTSQAPKPTVAESVTPVATSIIETTSIKPTSAVLSSAAVSTALPDGDDVCEL